MATNKHASVRYRIIDEALQKGKKIKGEELLEVIEKALEAQSIIGGISMKQLRNDIKAMKEHQPLGYNAPIKGSKNGYYYEDSNFSIQKCPILKEETKLINEALLTLEQFKHFGFFKELQGIVGKVAQRTKVTLQPLSPVIIFEKVEEYQGNDSLDDLYKAIINKKVLQVTYQPFDKPVEKLIVHPQLLKEHNNRWFLIVYLPYETEKYKQFRPLPLDRIIAFFETTQEVYRKANTTDLDNFFAHIIGVGLPWENQTVTTITLLVRKPRAYYLLTKPLHISQKVVSETVEGMTLTIDVIPNREFYAQILWFGVDIEVLSPEHVRKEVKQQLKETWERYT